MSLKDGLVLEFLRCQSRIARKPLYRNQKGHGHVIGYSTVVQRHSVFEEHGFVERVDDVGYHLITERGRAYLERELGVSDLEGKEG